MESVNVHMAIDQQFLDHGFRSRSRCMNFTWLLLFALHLDVYLHPI